MVLWRRPPQQFLQKFKNDERFYCHRIVIDYFPPSRHFSARRESTQDGAMAEPIVLLVIVLPLGTEVFRWQRPGVVGLIERATLERELNPVFRQLEGDLRREVDQSLWSWRI